MAHAFEGAVTSTAYASGSSQRDSRHAQNGRAVPYQEAVNRLGVPRQVLSILTGSRTLEVVGERQVSEASLRRFESFMLGKVYVFQLLQKIAPDRSDAPSLRKRFSTRLEDLVRRGLVQNAAPTGAWERLYVYQPGDEQQLVELLGANAASPLAQTAKATAINAHKEANAQINGRGHVAYDSAKTPAYEAMPATKPTMPGRQGRQRGYRTIKRQPSVTHSDGASLPSVFTLLQDYTNTPRLSEAQVQELVPRVKARDREALTTLTANYMRFILQTAAEIFKEHGSGSAVGLEIAELVNEGVIGLRDAALGYDAGKAFRKDIVTPTRFLSYAGLHIRGRMYDAIRSQQKQTGLSRAAYQQLGRVNNALEQLAQANGATPSVKEMARSVGLPEAKVAALLGFNSIEVKGLDLADTIADLSPSENVEESAISPIEQGSLKAALMPELHRILNPRELEVIASLFQINGENARTQEELGRDFRVSLSRISQIKIKALEKLEGSDVLRAIYQSQQQ